jgi:outer membrane protein assembly factor BamB
MSGDRAASVPDTSYSRGARAPLWSTKLPNAICGSAAAPTGDVLYVTSAEGHLRELDAATGDRLSEREAFSDDGSDFCDEGGCLAFLSAPVIRDANDGAEVLVASVPFHHGRYVILYAFRTQDQQAERPRRANTGLDRGSFRDPFPPALDEEGRLFLAWGGRLMAFGNRLEPLWTFKGGSWESATPAAACGLVVVGDDTGIIRAFDASEGQVAWQRKVGAAGVARRQVADDSRVYVHAGDGTVAALELASGKVDWRWRLPGTRPRKGSLPPPQPTLADGFLYLSLSGTRALDAATGELKWHDPAGTYASPIVDAGMVYVSIQEGIRVLDALSGAFSWEWAGADGIVETAPTVAGGSAFFGTNRGWFYGVPIGGLG